jgi:hypothetical protein
VRYPRVYLEEAVATGNEGGGGLAVRLEHLSSDPDLIGEPTAIFYTQERGRFGAELNASVDLRSGSENLGEYTLSLTGVDAALPAGARSFGFRELSGESELSTAGLLSREGALLGRLDLTAREVRLTPVADAGRTATIISEVLSSTGEVAAQISYRVEEGRLVAFSGTTSLAGAFRDRAEALAAELAAQAESRLRSELDALLEDELGEYAEATAALESLSRRSLEELREAETYREIARQQREELETRLAALREEAEDRARAEVEGQVEEARDRVEEEARRRLELPSFGD